MPDKRKIEVFTAGCALCAETLSAVKKAVASCGCEVIGRRCQGPELCAEAKQYRVTKMPTVVVDGQIVFEGRVTPAQAALLMR
jgi:glutaredoxin 3